MRLTSEQKRVISQEMAGLSGSEAKGKALALAQEFGCDWTRVYFYSRDVRPKRKRREDAGKLRAVDEEVLDRLSFFTVNYDMSAPHVAEIYAANSDGEWIAPSTYNRWLRNRDISRRRNKKDIKPWVPWEAPEPNFLHQVDSTVAQQFYLDDDGSIGFESKVKRYKNKPGNRKPRLTLISLVDDYSRVGYARFALGNHAFAWMDFLFHAWAKKDDTSGFPMHGLPKFLYTDNDSVVKSKKFQRAMDKLGVRPIQHEAGNSRATGKVENRFKFLQEFEKITQFEGWKSLDEANKALFDYLYYVNNRVHGGTKEVPFERWIKVSRERLRAAPSEEIFRHLHMDGVRRKINGKVRVSIDGREWQLPYREPFINFIGQSVELYWHPQDLDLIYVVLNGKEYPVQYAEPGMRGFGRYQELPEPAGLLRRKEIQAREAPDMKMSGFYKERHRRAYIAPDAAEPFDDSKIEIKTAGVVRTKTWFIQQLQREFLVDIPPLPHQTEWVDTYFGDSTEKMEGELRETIQTLIKDDSALKPKRTAQGGV